LLFVIISHIAFSQGIKGTVKDKNNKPIAFASVYVQQLQSGTQSTFDGDYNLKLADGDYTITFRALGFMPQTKTVTVKANKTEIVNIILLEQVYELSEVKIKANKEDPAYPIMRKAISLASYYNNQVKHFESEVYIKGSFKVINMPKLIGMMTDVNGRKVKTGDVFLQENLSEIIYDAPKKYTQKVISSKASWKMAGKDEVFGYLNGSFYQPNLFGIISPLSPDAFSYYRFVYEGFTVESGKTVYKIRVVPKNKNEKMLSGTIRIIDQLWSIHSIDVVNENVGQKTNIVQLYGLIKDNVWMPVSTNFKIAIDLMGVTVDGSMGTSTKYKNIVVNEKLPIPKMLATYYKRQNEMKDSTANVVKNKLKAKEQKKLDKLLSKEKLTNHQTKQVAKLMQKQNDDEKKSLEIKDNRNLVVEKGAFSKDTNYWSTARPAPLTIDEIKSYKINDSLISIETGKIKNDTTKKKSRKYHPEDYVFEKTFYSKDSSLKFYYNGLVNRESLNFNTVDGWIVGQSVSIVKNIDSTRKLSFNPKIYYSINRNKLYGVLNTFLNVSPLKCGSLYSEIGSISDDYNFNHSISRFENTITSLFFRRNYAKYYQRNYFLFKYDIEPVNGLAFSTQLEYDQHKTEQNISSFSIFYKNARDYTNNIPVNQYLSAYSLDSFNTASFRIMLKYTPMQYYRIRDGIKYNQRSVWPSFTLFYKKAFPISNIAQSDFDYIQLGINQYIPTIAYGSLSYSLKAGKFLSDKKLSFVDFKHVQSSDLPVFIGDLTNTFVFPKYYELSTPNQFIEGHAAYSSSYILLKYLPVLNKRLIWRENIYVNYLYSDNFKNYLEIGYGLSQIYAVFSLSVFSQIMDGKYTQTGLRVSLRF